MIKIAVLRFRTLGSNQYVNDLMPVVFSLFFLYGIKSASSKEKNANKYR